jgi:lysylphosphatidylglycerol synthetase-like protein (DUF2156 family)
VVAVLCAAVCSLASAVAVLRTALCSLSAVVAVLCAAVCSLASAVAVLRTALCSLSAVVALLCAAVCRLFKVGKPKQDIVLLLREVERNGKAGQRHTRNKAAGVRCRN